MIYLVSGNGIIDKIGVYIIHYIEERIVNCVVLESSHQENNA